MKHFAISIVFFCALSLSSAVLASTSGDSRDSSADVAVVLSKLKEYYKRVSTVQLECSQKETTFTPSNKDGTLAADDVRGFKLNLDKREMVEKIIDAKVAMRNRPEERLQSSINSLGLHRGNGGEIVINGDSRIYSESADIPPVFGGCDAVVPFGFFSNGKKTFHVIEWLENNPVKVLSATGNEYVVESDGSDGRLEVVLTNYNGSFYVTSFSYSIRADQRTLSLYDKVKYNVTDYKIIDNFWLPVQFDVEIFSHGEGTHRFDPRKKEIVPLPVRPYTLQSQVVFTDVKLNPFPKNKELTFDTPIPDYTQVQLFSQRQIAYVWVNGKIIPLTDELALARARGHGFIPGTREPRFWLMATGIGLILFALGRMTYSYLKRKGGSE